MEKFVVDTNDIKSNIKIIKKYIQENCNENNVKIPKTIAVVKGNGYGLGLVELSNFLINHGIDILAVAKKEDAIVLRKNEIKKEILLLSVTTIENDVNEIIDNNITPTIDRIEALEIYNKMAKEKNKVINVHVKIETGFGRYGLSINNIGEFIQKYKECDNIKIQGMFTHFSSAFAKNRKSTDIQYKKFMEAVKVFELNSIKVEMLHVCNSTAIFKYPKYYLDAVRSGSAIIGRLPIKGYKFGLKKVGYLEAIVSEVKELKKGENIGYANVCKLKKNSTIAICPVGYFEGIGLSVDKNVYRKMDILRNIKHQVQYFFRPPKKYVLINNEKYEIISNIGISNIIIDVTNSNVKVGDVVKIDVNPILIDSQIIREYR